MPPILATDLDGTLIPADHLLPGDPQLQALDVLQKRVAEESLEIVFVTGRHLQSVIEVMQQKELPKPQWIICDVGTSIFHREGGGDDQPYRPLQSYVNHLDQIVGSFSISQLVTQIKTHSRSEKGSDPLEASRLHDSLGLAGEGQIPFRIGSHDDLIFQEPEKQGRHKLSFYCKARTIDERVAAIELQLQEMGAPYRVVSSIDPFNGDGLIDLLPLGTDKASALLWWAGYRDRDPSQIVFAGDSGNDFAALTAGFRAIVVGNADRALAAHVAEQHRSVGHPERAYLATGHATAGVLEGCRHFGLIS